MAAQKKMTVKTLTEEFFKLKDDLNELTKVKQKMFELENALKACNDAKDEMKDQLKVLELKVDSLQKTKDLPNSKKFNNEETSTERTKCRKCDDTFPSMKSLKRHVSSNHAPRIECKDCDKIFSKNYDLEVHITTDHKPREVLKCDKCDKHFVLKWRLLKHKQNHDNISKPKCHYFNNNLTCPFEEMGCMFAHELSDMCKFDKKCTKNLCSFVHTQSTEVEPDDKEIDDYDDSEETEYVENESEENEVEPCESCGEMFDDIEDLIDHYGTTGHLK